MAVLTTDRAQLAFLSWHRENTNLRDQNKT
jgi:hypothetical protein